MDAWHALPGVVPKLAPFALALALLAVVLPLCRRFGLPQAVLLLLAGVLLGPHGLGAFSAQRPVADFFAELGKLLLMFIAGLQIDLHQLVSCVGAAPALRCSPRCCRWRWALV